MKPAILPTALLALGLALAAPAARAHDCGHGHGSHVEKHMAKTAERLNLTDAQKQQLRPLVEEHFAQAKAIRDRYPRDASSEQKKQMFDEMRALREDHDGKFRALLTDEQRQAWETLRSERAERRERMREHARERRETSTT